MITIDTQESYLIAIEDFDTSQNTCIKFFIQNDPQPVDYSVINKSEVEKAQKVEKVEKRNTKPIIPVLDLSKVPGKFEDEFKAAMDEFSNPWREAVEKETTEEDNQKKETENDQKSTDIWDINPLNLDNVTPVDKDEEKKVLPVVKPKTFICKEPEKAIHGGHS